MKMPVSTVLLTTCRTSQSPLIPLPGKKESFLSATKAINNVEPDLTIAVLLELPVAKILRWPSPLQVNSRDLMNSTSSVSPLVSEVDLTTRMTLGSTALTTTPGRNSVCSLTKSLRPMSSAWL